MYRKTLLRELQPRVIQALTCNLKLLLPLNRSRNNKVPKCIKYENVVYRIAEVFISKLLAIVTSVYVQAENK